MREWRTNRVNANEVDDQLQEWADRIERALAPAGEVVTEAVAADLLRALVTAARNGKPLAPIVDPYQMFNKLYGRSKDREVLASVLDDLTEDLKKVQASVSAEDRRLLDEHAQFVREMETELKASKAETVGHAVPEIEPGVKRENDQIPKISKTPPPLKMTAGAGK